MVRFIGFLFTVLTAVSGNAFAQAGNVYGANQAQVVGGVETGIVLQVSIKKVEGSWQTRAAGTTAGGLFGSLAAAGMGGDTQTKALLGILGATLGAVAGERVADSVSSRDAQEVVIALLDKTGAVTRIINVVQPAPFDPLMQNDQVLVAGAGSAMRVIKKNF